MGKIVGFSKVLMKMDAFMVLEQGDGVQLIAGVSRDVLVSCYCLLQTDVFIIMTEVVIGKLRLIFRVFV